jgi:CrcB protein
MPVDPDLQATPGAALRDALRAVVRRGDKLVVIAAGGALGSGARYALAEAMPHGPGELAWSTVSVNVTGGFLLGLLMVFLLEVWGTTRYVRPFFAIGVLGGFTTFSTYMVDTLILLQAERPVAAVVYLLGSLITGLLAVWAGLVAARLIVRRGRLHRRSPQRTPPAAEGTTVSRSTP